MKSDPKRPRDLARIHLAKKDLGLDDETYRSLLRATTGKDSAAAMGPGERWKVLCELGRLGGKAGASKPYPGKPAIVTLDKQALLGKIEAQLAEAKRPWAYAHGIAWKMFKKNQWRWTMNTAQKVALALSTNQTLDARMTDSGINPQDEAIDVLIHALQQRLGGVDYRRLLEMLHG